MGIPQGFGPGMSVMWTGNDYEAIVFILVHPAHFVFSSSKTSRKAYIYVTLILLILGAGNTIGRLCGDVLDISESLVWPITL